MSNTCPRPDTRNRYEGRGSGDRIARLKALATRQGPAPTNQNSASWNLTNQQSCCQVYVTISNCSGSVMLSDTTYTLVITNAFSSTIIFDIFTGVGNTTRIILPANRQITSTEVSPIVKYEYICGRTLTISACNQTNTFNNAPYLYIDSLLDTSSTVTITESNGTLQKTTSVSVNERSSRFFAATSGYTIISTSVSCP
jgi:hypothetical protein